LEIARFRRGEALFNRPFTPDAGLGPLFNQDRCSSCHDLPTSGGTGAESVLMATRFEPPGACDLLEDEGGRTIQLHATPLLAAHGIGRERVPARANGQATVTPPALFGLGLVEAIPEAALLALADPEDADGNGISGRLVRRFGRRAEFATLRDFVEDALRLELGITSPSHPLEQMVNGTSLPPGTDPAPDPEIDDASVDLLTDYVRMLAPPMAVPPASDAARDTLAAGERAFHSAGCASCHVPTMRTGRHPHPAFAGKAVRLYSDLLLHDVGPELKSVCGVAASPAEFRTASLVGVRHRSGLLHDGRANSVWGAVMLHGGEAAGAREAFRRLPAAAQEALVAFLYSL
jgi:CxxC motif-containing protein (DUF1111 family)